MTPGKRIRRLRVQNNLGQKELADELGYKTYTTISKWESDKSLPPGRELKKLAIFFKISVDYILVLDDFMNRDELSPIADTVGLPVYESFSQALIDRESTEANRNATVAPQLTLEEGKENYFVIKIKTDSVNRLIPPDSKIIILDFAVADDTSLNSGDIIVVKIEDKYRILTIRKTDLTIYLEPASFIEGFETLQFTIEEFSNLHVIGKVVTTYQVFD